MQKKQRSKEMTGEAADPKGVRLVCIKECVAPGYGFWTNGDIVSDPLLVERFKLNPHFEIAKED